MPNENLSEIIILLDRSGSMQKIAEDTRGGFDTFVAEQRKLPGECVLTLVQFDSDGIDTVHESKPIADVPPLVFVPRSWTPLLDAIGQTIMKVGQRYAALAEDKRPGKVIFVIITDGQENCSQEFKLAQIKEMIGEQISKWKWKFTYLGANVDAFAEAALLGIPTLGAANVAHDSKGTKAAYRGLSGSVGRSRVSGQSLSYTPEEREEMLHKVSTPATPAAAPSSSSGT